MNTTVNSSKPESKNQPDAIRSGEGFPNNSSRNSSLDLSGPALTEKTGCILFCQCSQAGLIPAEKINQVRHSLLNREERVLIVDDLCHAAVREPEKLRDFLQTGPVTILACHERAVKGLLHRAGITRFSSDKNELHTVNLRQEYSDSTPVDPICDCKLKKTGRIECLASTANTLTSTTSEWPAWYPVIDYDRCTDCGQCSSFCLFGVYDQDSSSGEVCVLQPDHCKNNCPACARTCPEVAIIFPKLEESPINGAPVTDESLEASRVQMNIDEITGSETYRKYALQQANPQRGRLIRMLTGKASQECACELGK